MGTLWRTAHIFGADFIYTIGCRYKKQPTDTLKSTRHLPLFHFNNWDDFLDKIPNESNLVICEQGGKPLKELNHPKQAIYVLGAEDDGVPIELSKGHQCVEIESMGVSSLNVATAGAILMYDRFTS